MRETFDILPKEIGWRTDKIGYEPPQKSWMESGAMKGKLIESKNKLIENKIINIKNENFSASEATTNSFSWNLLMSANLS
jgi:asparagine synthase (glutamine-hydrolysing)